MATTCQIDGQTFFTDLPSCVVGGLQAASGPGGGWFPFKYTFDCFSGVGLSTAALSPAGELVLDLGLTGWHRMHVVHTPAVRMWLDGETGYCEVLCDGIFPAADFTGRKLHIAPVRSTEVNRELIFYFLRAEPCDPPENHRNLIVTNDGHDMFYFGIDGPRDLYSHLYSFRDSDVFRMVWGVYGGGPLSLNPDSKVAESPIRPDEQLFYEGEYRFTRSLRRFADAGIDPLAVWCGRRRGNTGWSCIFTTA